MKVLHIIGGGDIGGAKTHIFSLLSSLKNLVEIKLVCLRDGDFAKEAISIGFDKSNLEVIEGSNLFKTRKSLLNIQKEFNADIIHCHGAKANIVGMLTKKKLKGVLFISTVHSDYKHDYDHSLLRKLTIGHMYVRALKKVDYYECVSYDLKEKLVSNGFEENKIFHLTNGFDFNSTNPTVSKKEFLEKHNIPYGSETIYVGILARLTKVKGVDVFIQAAKIVIETMPNTKFLIAGDGEEKSQLEKTVENLGISENVFFLGHVDGGTNFLNSIDINVLSSHTEGFPYSIIEGASLKKPTISSDVGGINTLIEQSNTGILFEDNNYEQLAEAIIYLEKNTAIRTSLGENIHLRAQRIFSISKMTSTQIDIYNYILKIKDNFEKDPVDIFGIKIAKLPLDKLLDKVKTFLIDDKNHFIFTPNVEMLMRAMKNEEFKTILNSSDFDLPDGAGVVLAAKMLKNPIEKRTAGIDFITNCFSIDYKRKLRIYLFGAKPGVAEKAAENIMAEYPNVQVVGVRNGYFSEDDNANIVQEINITRPDFLLVALGCPRQEEWIYNNISDLQAKISIGIGGSLDVFAGEIKRAPKLFREHHLEWFYRLVTQPYRIGRMMSIPKFFLILLKRKFFTKKPKDL